MIKSSLAEFVEWVKNELTEFESVMDPDMDMDDLLEQFQEWIEVAAEPPTYD